MSLTRRLSPVECRVLGALMEKEQATPDHYPLTVNTLISACNQKSNREPVTDLTETQVVEALDALRVDVLAWRSEGARVERWEHCLDRRWHLTAAAKAVMTLLLLRGPQTPGELKGRSGRLHDFESADQVEATLTRLAEGGDDALVEELPRAPGQRECRWMHRVGTEEVYALYEAPAAPRRATPPPAHPAVSGPGPGPANPPNETKPSSPALADRVAALEERVVELTGELHALRERLGDV